MSDPEPPPPKRQPRQLAIALGYDWGSETAPKVVARGYGKVAEQILEIAFAHNVKVREDPDLAQILAAVEIDCEIPIEAFTAVAEILSYVYQANSRLRPAEPAPEDRLE
ncbi:MAG: EscU/YscU/HrcU family type III secretion system export apparatus switch protein [Proteobacteria bacterium]|nr:EscU/YscU/HrcU family type III secretion system export apparatus switch protein [Pseudomonadota bacterium]MBI3497222.1 EscU/YscU/HrcU family type III secretion system export apparatus switch protein [Pseudomonadota bacterium]